MAMPTKLRRRSISWPALHVGAVLLVALAGPALVVLLVADLVRGRWHLHLTRVYLLGLGMVCIELAFFWLGLLTSAVTLNGRLVPAWAWAGINVWLQNRWIAGQVAVARLTSGFRIEIENPELTREANAIVMGRHLSHADAVFPAMVYGLMAGHQIRYMLKQELQWPPAMDLIGNRLPHVWIDRAPGPDSPMLAVMERTAHDVDERTVACIFPEGTFFTPERLERAITRLAGSRPDLAREARSLRHVLPPRPAGSLALLEGAPGADVVVLGHIGLERFSSIRDIIGAIPLTEPIRVRLWRHPRSEIPDNPRDQTAWLVRRWIQLDDWISEHLETPAGGSLPVEDSVA
jgi:1-acyl-sn-glycerol-3-phosphate acyltransferase